MERAPWLTPPSHIPLILTSFRQMSSAKRGASPRPTAAIWLCSGGAGRQNGASAWKMLVTLWPEWGQPMPSDPQATVAHLPRTLRAAILRFQRNPHVLRAEIDTPFGANGMCGWASAAFADMCPAAEAVDVQGSRINFLNPDGGERGGIAWHDRIGHWSCACHTVARAGRWYLDWTARQFDATAPWPLVMTERDLRRRWLKIGRNVDV